MGGRIMKGESKSKEKIKHDDIIERLEKRLMNFGMIVYKKKNYVLSDEEELDEFNLPYSDRYGEIDIYAVHPNRKILISIEVKESKCESHDQKAHKQLKKDILYLSKVYPGFRIKSMYAYGKEENPRGYGVDLYIPKFKPM
jgi:hypothetical protein